MKILISAYACEPGKGSEPGAGLAAVEAAASEHRVWLLTRENNLPILSRHLRGKSLENRVTIEGLDIPGLLHRNKNRGSIWLSAYYRAWQRLARKRAMMLDRSVDFDVVHHATFANYWSAPGVAGLGKPFVWGPIGGGVDPPRRLIPALGVSGTLADTARFVVRKALASSPAVVRSQRAASVVLVQNHETQRRLRHAKRIEFLPNPTAIDVGDVEIPDKRTSRVVMAGRLIPLKAIVLAIEAFSQVRTLNSTLHIFGTGPDRARIERKVRDLRLAGRVFLEGHRPRHEVLASIAGAGAFLHTALHEEAGWAVAEALSLGTPVVCIDHGGPTLLAQLWEQSPSRLVPPGGRKATATALGQALDEFLQRPPVPPDTPLRPSTDFAARLLAAYDAAIELG